MAKGALDLEIAVKAAIVRPGDTLIFVTSRRCTDAEFAALRARIGDLLPGVKFGLADGIDQALVYKPDEIPTETTTL